VLEQCGEVEGRRVVDAYCGYGVRSLEASSAGADVVGIDFDRRAIRTARALAERLGNEPPARFVTARVEAAIAAQLPADVVMLNPPRRGLAPPVTSALLARPPRRVVYASCDPATLARDLRALAPSFDLVGARGFDLFPQTAHVEVVATLSRR
jgi:23S rRNA (uracil1939-C5)-methyltransferase